MFSRCSVGVVPHVDIFLMYCGEEGDLHVLPLRHLEGPPIVVFLNRVLVFNFHPSAGRKTMEKNENSFTDQQRPIEAIIDLT